MLKVPVDGELNIGDKDSTRSRDLFFDALNIKDLGQEHLDLLISGLKNI